MLNVALLGLVGGIPQLGNAITFVIVGRRLQPRPGVMPFHLTPNRDSGEAHGSNVGEAACPARSGTDGSQSWPSRADGHGVTGPVARVPRGAFVGTLASEVSTMLGAGAPMSPVPSEGGGSWVWILVAVAVVLAFLALTWWARLWGRASSAAEEEPKVPSSEAKKAA
jgi:hypothetical protein